MVDNNDGYRVFLCDTATGDITLDLPSTGHSWGMRIGKPGTVSTSLRPGAEEFADVDLRGHTRLLAQSLGVAYNGRILECGPIWNRTFDDTGTLSLSAEGIGSLFQSRKAVAGDMLRRSAPITSSTLNLSGSLSDIARELVRISLYDNPYLPGPLNNIILPAVTGGPHVRTINGFDLRWISEVLDELSGGQDGIDIRFRPRFDGANPNRVEWVMETGDPLLEQAGADWVWDGGVEGTGLGALTTDEDASTMAAFAYAPGAGQERAMRLATAVNEDFLAEGLPWVEQDQAAKDIADPNVLQSHAERTLDDGDAPWVTVGVEVRADIAPTLGEYLPGEWARIIVPDGHPTQAPGEMRVRVMAVDGGADNKVRLTVAPFQDEMPDNGGQGNTVITSDDDGHLKGSWSSLNDSTWVELPPGKWNEVI